LQKRREARIRRRAAIITSCILLLALLAADIYVAFAPEYQIRQPAAQPVQRLAEAPVEKPAPIVAFAPEPTPLIITQKRNGPRPPSLKLEGKSSASIFDDLESPIALAAALSLEDSGIRGDGKPGNPPRIQGFDTLVALVLFGPGGGGGGGGTPPTGNPPPGVDQPPPGGDNPPDDNPTPPGGDDNPPVDNPPPDPDGEFEPPVLETPIPGAFFLFGPALAGLLFARSKRRALKVYLSAGDETPAAL